MTQFKGGTRNWADRPCKEECFRIYLGVSARRGAQPETENRGEMGGRAFGVVGRDLPRTYGEEKAMWEGGRGIVGGGCGRPVMYWV